MVDTNTAKPTLKELIRALRAVAPVQALIFAAAFLIGFTAKLFGLIDVSLAAMPFVVGALVGLYRKRASIETVIVEQVRSRSMAASS